MYGDIYRDVETTGGVPRPPRDADALLRYPAAHPHHILWLGKSYQDVLDGHFHDPRLKRFLSALTGYGGAPASAVDASLMAIIFGGYYLDGGYYPRGGSQVLADALAGVIVARGGSVRTSTRVDRVLVSGGMVRGVTTARGEQFEAPVVVSNADLKQTFGDLVYTLSSEGAIYGIERGRDLIDDQRPAFKPPIEGLYLAGASTFPGAGIEAVVISGVIAADDISPVSAPSEPLGQAPAKPA